MTQIAKTKILGRNRTRLQLWKEHLKEQIVALDKALKCLEKPWRSRSGRAFGPPRTRWKCVASSFLPGSDGPGDDAG